ncbi:GntR family transcriptional regulator [Paenarthrobacter nitroguajacolicus]|uniref:GntR family transcriptional regulator n=1 Tax=Paenarthrobacter nitroguajacolicus TaxID=211146 RepID=UPI000AFCBDFA|nr:GntR family transcriptional regulator [Paenarthrobacter nitroguajacolicus]
MGRQQSVPLHARLSQEFKRRITGGDWPPGFQLPSEAELSLEFGTSRGPIRQALALLRSEGVLTGGRGRPPQVRSSVPSQTFSTFTSFTEWATEIGKTPGQRTLEVARRRSTLEAAEALGLAPGTNVVELLRVRYLDEKPAMIERTTFILDVGKKVFLFDANSGSIFAYLKEQGVDLHSSRQTIDAVSASAQDAELLNAPIGTPLLRERRLTRSSDGQPIEFSDGRSLPTLTNFTIDNNVNRPATLIRVPTDGL